MHRKVNMSKRKHEFEETKQEKTKRARAGINDLSEQKDKRAWIIKPENVFVGVFENIPSRWFNEKASSSFDSYFRYLLDTDLIYDVMNLKNKTLGYTNAEGKKIVQYLESLVSEKQDLVWENTRPKIRKFWPIVALRHNTANESVESILKYGLLTYIESAHKGDIRLVGADQSYRRPGDEYLKKGQGTGFAGVYFTTIYDYNQAKAYREHRYNEVSLYIDPYILNRYDFHVNTLDNFGRISPEITYSRRNFADLLDRLMVLTIGEIIFHNQVEPVFIKHMNGYDKDDLKDEKLLSRVQELEAKVKSANFYEQNQKIIDQVYVPLLRDDKYPPRFCTTKVTFEDRAATFFKTARNCGFSDLEIQDPKFDETREINKRYEEMSLGTRPITPTIYYPPYEDSPVLDFDSESYEIFRKRVT